MSVPLALENLLACCLQIAGLALAGLWFPSVLRLHASRPRYYYGQAVLVVCLVLPFIQPWCPTVVANAAGHMLFESKGAGTRLAASSATWMVFPVLASGMVLRWLWMALGFARLARYRRAARRLEPLPPGIQQAAAQLGVEVDFRLSGEIRSPVTFGFRHPVILLPASFAALDASRQRAIATHELLHVCRRDWLMNLAEEAVLAIYWFHPAIWWLISRIRLSREQVVDQRVVELTRARTPYIHALVEMAAGPEAARALVAPAFLRECQLAERLRALTRRNCMTKRKIIITLACVMVLTLAATIGLVRKFPLRTYRTPAVAWNPVHLPPNVFSIGNGVSAPVPIYKPHPAYTQAARAAKLQGTSILQILVGADGDVKSATIARPFDQGLDQSAVDTVKTWKFQPALRAGKPVACRVMVEVSFRIF